MPTDTTTGPVAAAVHDLQAIADRCGVRLDELIGACLRPMIRAGAGNKLAAADINAVEARLLAYFAGQDDLVAAFHDGRDCYREFAAAYLWPGRDPADLTKAQRAVGKIAILSCGYQSGADTFAAMCLAQGVDLAASGFRAVDVVEAYRDAYPAIAGEIRVDRDGERMRYTPPDKGYAITIREGGIWRALDAAARRVVSGESDGEAVGAGFQVHFEMGTDGELRLELPAGRPIVYPAARIEDVVPTWGGDAKPAVVYTRRSGTVPMYGGKWTENVIQAVAWDLMAAAIVATEAAGWPVVMHVHDELVCEVPEADAAACCDFITRQLSQSPGWIPGLPLAAEGAVTDYFTKGAPAGSYECNYRNGERQP